MSVEDLAIDVGLVQDTEEFDVFVSSVTNILELGCGYCEASTKDIMDKCYTSELDIAKKVLRECRRRPRTLVRKSRLKWWQSYMPKRRPVEEREPSTVPDKARRPLNKTRRPMELTFHNAHRRHERRRPRALNHPHVERRRPSSPQFEHKKRRYSPEYRPTERRRPMSPLFEPKQRRYPQDETQYDRRSPVGSRYSDVPRWPDRSEHQHQNSRKRRRYR